MNENDIISIPLRRNDLKLIALALEKLPPDAFHGAALLAPRAQELARLIADRCTKP